MIKRIVLFISLLMPGSGLWAQISLTNGEHSLEISGTLSTYYNARFYTPGNKENRINDRTELPFYKGKNRFTLRDVQLQLEGRVGKDWEYEMQVDFADLINTTDVGENPGLMDGWAQWNGKGIVAIRAGYQKLPYSRNSLVPFAYSPFWQRSELTRGEFFARRDVGITLEKSLWNQRINAYAGVYTGMGEQILTFNGGDNDPGGTLEYLGRVDVAFPSRFRYRDYDLNATPIPMLAIGLAGRYVQRKYSSFLVGDDYWLRVIAGKRTMATADISFQYKGFAAQAEFHLAEYRPTNEIDPDVKAGRYREDRGTKQAKIGSNPTNYFRAGGLLANLSYSSRPLKSIVSIRYENFNPNDLVKDNTEQTLSFAYAYLINGFNAAIKCQYWYRMVDRKNLLIQRFDDQIRVGMQFLLR